MVLRNREAELSPAVCDWLRSLGYSPYAEVKGGYGFIDHVGVRWSDESIICVEMKTVLSWQVIRQASWRSVITPLTYAAVPGMPRRASLEQAAKFGIGVWADGRVVAEPNPPEFRTVHEKYRCRVLEQCRKASEGGIGGLPTLKGDGPALRVAAAVRAYREANPTATWKEIFQNVPNHYAHYRSMQGAMLGRVAIVLPLFKDHPNA